MPVIKTIFVILLILALIAVLVVIVINLRIGSYSTNRIFNDIESVPSDDRVAIVLGARVYEDGEPSNTLYDRTLTGVELYKAGKTSRLLLSGGGAEPEAMRKIALDQGIPEDAIILDDLGLRTYESCIRAKQVFGIERAIVVTQDYHLPRSIYLCQNMGIDSIGINAKRRDYLGERYAWFREYISRVLAWTDINFKTTA